MQSSLKWCVIQILFLHIIFYLLITYVVKVQKMAIFPLKYWFYPLGLKINQYSTKKNNQFAHFYKVWIH